MHTISDIIVLIFFFKLIHCLLKDGPILSNIINRNHRFEILKSCEGDIHHMLPQVLKPPSSLYKILSYHYPFVFILIYFWLAYYFFLVVLFYFLSSILSHFRCSSYAFQIPLLINGNYGFSTELWKEPEQPKSLFLLPNIQLWGKKIILAAILTSRSICETIGASVPSC